MKGKSIEKELFIGEFDKITQSDILNSIELQSSRIDELRISCTEYPYLKESLFMDCFNFQQMCKELDTHTYGFTLIQGKDSVSTNKLYNSYPFNNACLIKRYYRYLF